MDDEARLRLGRRRLLVLVLHGIIDSGGGGDEGVFVFGVNSVPLQDGFPGRDDEIQFNSIQIPRRPDRSSLLDWELW